MSQKRGSWIINLVVVVTLLSLVGFFMIPLLGNVLTENQPSAGATSVPKQNAAARQADLEAQARGYELVLQREPDNRTALRGILEVRLQQGDLKATIAPLEKLAKLNPEQPDYTVLLAQTKQQMGDREGAAQAYRTVLTSQPGEMNALQGLVSLLIQQQRPEAAIGLLQETLKAAPQANQTQPGSIEITSVQLLLAQVYVNQQRYTEAIAIYDEAVKSNKQDFRPLLAKALVMQQIGRPAEAKPLFNTAISLAPAQYKDQIKQMAMAAPTTLPSTPTISPSIAPSSPPVAPNPAPSAP